MDDLGSVALPQFQEPWTAQQTLADELLPCRLRVNGTAEP